MGKTFIMLKIFCFELLLNFPFIKESWEKYHCFHKKYLVAQLFSTLVIQNVSWKSNHDVTSDHVTLKTGAMAAENSALPTQE